MYFSNLEIAKGLNRIGHRVEVATLTRAGASQFASNLDFPVHLLPKWPRVPTYSLVGRGLLNWVFAPWHYGNTRRIVERFKPDVVFVADETTNAFWGIWAQRIRIPYVAYCSVPFLSSRVAKGRQRFLSDVKYPLDRTIRNRIQGRIKASYQNAKKVLCVSHSTKSALVHEVPGIRDKLEVVPRSIDNTFFDTPVDLSKVERIRSTLGDGKDLSVLLSVSNLIRGKGIEDVIRALSRLERSLLDQIVYLIIGDGPMASELKDMVDELNLSRFIRFAGFVPHNDLIPYYDACDFFVLPSRRRIDESFGRVFVEAASRSKPSIGSRDGGMQDIIQNGRNGYLVRAGAVGQISEKISLLIGSARKRTMMGIEARRHAAEKFTTATIVAAMERQLSQVCSN